MSKRKAVTQEELNQAVRKFLKSGGTIQKLPDQKSVSQHLVGAKWGTTELGGSLQN